MGSCQRRDGRLSLEECSDAMAGEQILIRQGDSIVELRPADSTKTANQQWLPPREALRRIQEEARLKPEQAEQYLREVRDERL